jgi:hypothetical protein
MHRYAPVVGLLGLFTLAACGATVGSCAEADPVHQAPPPEPVRQVQQRATGVCDANPPASTQACVDAIQANGGAIVNDVFKDTNGLTADQLPVFGTLFNNWPGCSTTHLGCAGQSLAPFDCPAQYQCNVAANTFANASQYMNALDRLWWQPYRLVDHALDGNGCPNWAAVTTDGVGGNYFPWEGLVFDLGGPSNKVAIFAENDHGPQPCESLEYTVYLTDDPFSKELIQKPAVDGVDPKKWNRAVLTTIFTKGFVEVRPPDPVGHAACGDTALYSVEEDSFAQVFALPCGITFRYAAIIAGNDGLDFAECAFDSSEAELDAVAGLTEGGAGVCPDADGDLYVECMCPGAPPVCDCDDTDPAVHPLAPEPCDAMDLDCDKLPGSCETNLYCHQSICIPPCGGGENPCPLGSSCKMTPQGNLCVPEDCAVGGCPPGSVCEEGICVPACDDVTCPGDQVCKDGVCLDPCKDVQCAPPQVCQNGSCVAPCSCFAADVGCESIPGSVCDKGNTDTCVPPACKDVKCSAAQKCDPTNGMCVDFCNPNVNCPPGQKCVAPTGCVPLCDGVTCDEGLECNPKNGLCEDLACQDVVCFAPTVCDKGMCVVPDGGVGEGGAGGGDAGAGGSTGSAATSPRDPGETGGCGCRVPGDERSDAQGGGLGVLLVGAAAAALARVRRGRGRTRGECVQGRRQD